MVRKTIICFAVGLLSAIVAVADDMNSPRRLRSNWLLPVCVPVDVSSTRVGELFVVGCVEDGIATIFPVNNVAAGHPFVVRPNRDITIDSLLIGGYEPVANGKCELPWHGGHILTDMDTYLWSYVSEDHDTIAARQLQFQVMRPMEMNFRVNLENLAVRQYMREVSYEREDDSQIEQYYMMAPPERRDLPNPVSIPVSAAAGADNIVLTYTDREEPENSITVNIDSDEEIYQLYNLVPGHSYNYEIIADGEVVSKGAFETEGLIRMIYAPSVANIRDIGGWRNADGIKIKYGKIYRGGELNGQHIAEDADIELLKELGIKAEIDLRHTSEAGAGVSAFGFLDDFEVDYDEQYSFLFTNNSGCEIEHFNYPGVFWLQRWRNEFEFIVDCLKHDMPVYQHCIWGADRTGVLSMMLEALLGVSYSDIVKDYELTSFSEGIRRKASIDKLLDYFEQFDGITLQEKMEHFFTQKLQVSRDDIDYFRDEMLEGHSLSDNDLASVTDIYSRP